MAIKIKYLNVVDDFSVFERSRKLANISQTMSFGGGQKKMSVAAATAAAAHTNLDLQNYRSKPSASFDMLPSK